MSWIDMYLLQEMLHENETQSTEKDLDHSTNKIIGRQNLLLLQSS